MAKKRVALLNIIRVTKNVQASLQTVLPFFSDGLLLFNAIKEISFHSLQQSADISQLHVRSNLFTNLKESLKSFSCHCNDRKTRNIKTKRIHGLHDSIPPSD